MQPRPPAHQMPLASASAPGKLILCGEHAVVYCRPAIALPLNDICAYAEIHRGRPGSGPSINAIDLDREWYVDATTTEPLGELIYTTMRHLDIIPREMTITLSSDVPITAGLGSGAAIATALVRAVLAAHPGTTLTTDQVSALVYQSEQRYHGTPSGIDNTVIAYEQPVWFLRQTAPASEGESAPQATLEPVAIGAPFTLIIGDTGVRSKTSRPVGDVRQRWQSDPTHYEALFDQVGDVVTRIRTALAAGDLATLGSLLNDNQTLLEAIGVSSPELEHLIAAARTAGALGAKLSGAGWGGVMIALDYDDNRRSVAQALKQAGAVQVLSTRIETQEARWNESWSL